MGGTCYNCEAAKARETWAWTGMVADLRIPDLVLCAVSNRLMMIVP